MCSKHPDHSARLPQRRKVCVTLSISRCSEPLKYTSAMPFKPEQRQQSDMHLMHRIHLPTSPSTHQRKRGQLLNKCSPRTTHPRCLTRNAHTPAPVTTFWAKEAEKFVAGEWSSLYRGSVFEGNTTKGKALQRQEIVGCLVVTC